MKFTDKEIRDAYRDCKASRDLANALGCKEAEREAFVKMTALVRWMHDRKAARKPRAACVGIKVEGGE